MIQYMEAVAVVAVMVAAIWEQALIQAAGKTTIRHYLYFYSLF
jgi:hypothetical protein